METDGRIDGRTGAIALPPVLRRSRRPAVKSISFVPVVVTVVYPTDEAVGWKTITYKQYYIQVILAAKAFIKVGL